MTSTRLSLTLTASGDRLSIGNEKPPSRLDLYLAALPKEPPLERPRQRLGPAPPPLGGAGKQALSRGRLDYRESHPEVSGYLFIQCQPVHRIVWVDQERNFRGARHQFPQEFYPFFEVVSRHVGRKPGYVAARTR